MQAAKDAVKKFTSRDGAHDTSVHETVNPAVQNETVHQQQEERIHPAVDKEVHQDHFHDKETLAEQHHHRAGNVEHRNFEHGDHQASKDLHAREAAQFTDTSTRVQGETTRTVQPTVGGEHVHHHVHEQIQPIVHKQTIEPHVVHTTQPVHETHHNEAKHHQTSTLPAVGIDEFKSGGGVLTGRGEKVDGFEGCPKGSHGGNGLNSGVASSTGTHSHSPTAGDRDNALTDKINGSNTSSGVTGTHNGLSGHNSSHTGTGAGVAAVGGAGATGAAFAGAQHASNQHQKPSLVDKLNPSKDADGDGKKGFMK